MHTAALAEHGLAGSYQARQVDPNGMHTAAAEVRAALLTGANITMPHKHLAAELSDELHEDAAQAGSVNTWVASNSQIVGYSTDIEAIRRCFVVFPPMAPVLVLGAGGAAAAAVVALQERLIYVSSRRPEAASNLAAQHGANTWQWGSCPDGAIVLNATPLGMRQGEIPASILEPATGLFDLAYGPQPPAAVVEARRRTLPVVEGLEMLVEQAALSFELWTGVKPSRLSMRLAAESSQAST